MFARPWYTLDAIKTGKPYKIRALLAHANNSLLSMPDALHTYECLKELEFFVYMDFFMTPTAELADIVLPAALWAEVDSFFCMPEFGDQVVAAAMIDRIVHHADVLTLKGASYRLRNRGIDTLPSIRTQDAAD